MAGGGLAAQQVPDRSDCSWSSWGPLGSSSEHSVPVSYWLGAASRGSVASCRQGSRWPGKTNRPALLCQELQGSRQGLRAVAVWLGAHTPGTQGNSSPRVTGR